MVKPNKEPRYRLKPSVAKKLGLKVKKYNRYTLTKEQEKKYLQMSQGYQIKRLFFDIETSRMVLQKRVFHIKGEQRLSYDDVVEESKIICISWKWEGEDKVYNARWDENHCDKKLLQKVIPIMNEADEVIGHNGDRFDIPIIRTRALYHRIPFRAVIRSLDTLKKARSFFRFPNNKLDTIARYCGVGGKVEHEGIKMWEETENGNLEYLGKMVFYCDGDVVVLEDVWLVMQNYFKHNTHVGLHSGGQKAECPNCGSEKTKHIKNNFTAAGTIKRLMECDTCEYTYEISNAAYRQKLEFDANFAPQNLGENLK